MKRKIIEAEQEWLDQQPAEPELDWEFIETSEFGQDGWTISYRLKSNQNDRAVNSD